MISRIFALREYICSKKIFAELADEFLTRALSTLDSRAFIIQDESGGIESWRTREARPRLGDITPLCPSAAFGEFC